MTTVVVIGLGVLSEYRRPRTVARSLAPDTEILVTGIRVGSCLCV